LPRRSRRFYVEKAFPAEGGLLLLPPRETFHLYKVLRLQKGDSCQLFNRDGWSAEAVIETVSELEGAKLRLKKVFPMKQKSLFLKVAQALPQKRKMDDLVEKAEELSVQELWVLETKRNVVKMNTEGRARAKARWERIVVEAAKQSGSSVLTRVEGPVAFEKVVKEKLEASDRPFLFHPDPEGLPFTEFVEMLKSPKTQTTGAPVFLFFGPEGGFTEEEVRLAESRGAKKVFLGDSVLRLETAFLGVLSALRLLVF